MLIPVKIEKGLKVNQMNIEDISFKQLNIKEGDIEEFLRVNIGELLSDETLLIVGQQVKNSENGRSDLTAIDRNGNLVLIEIKRDMEDIKQRKEPFEFQAIRYAASYAKIDSPEELVDKIFAPYIGNYKEEFSIGDLTNEEKATRILNEFLFQNKIQNTFNAKQRIILVASKFDNQTLSAVAWLISNGVDISCFEITPKKIGDNNFLDVNKILPTISMDDYYIEIRGKSASKSSKQTSESERKTLPKMDKLLEWEVIKPGQVLEIKGYVDSSAVVKTSKLVEYKGDEITFNEWGKRVTKWTTINIYEWAKVVESGKTLNELRKEKIELLEKEDSALED